LDFAVGPFDAERLAAVAGPVVVTSSTRSGCRVNILSEIACARRVRGVYVSGKGRRLNAYAGDV